MSTRSRLIPGKATQEVIAKIQRDASQPAPEFASGIPDFKQSPKGKNLKTGTKRKSFRKTNPT